MTTPRLLMPQIAESQASKYLTHNEALRVIDGLSNITVQDTLNTPPASPTDGQCWIVGTSPTGAWAGQANKIAQRYNAAWYFHTPIRGWRAYNLAITGVMVFNGTTWINGLLQTFVCPCTTETGAVTAATNVYRFNMPYAFRLTEVRASLNVAQASGNILTIDVNDSGVSVLSTRITIDNTELTSVTAAALPVISTPSLADNDLISIDVDQIGNGSAQGLKVYLIGYRVI